MLFSFNELAFSFLMDATDAVLVLVSLHSLNVATSLANLGTLVVTANGVTMLPVADTQALGMMIMTIRMIQMIPINLLAVDAASYEVVKTTRDHLGRVLTNSCLQPVVLGLDPIQLFSSRGTCNIFLWCFLAFSS
jgi:hypothetical protein